jgi:gamma-glutamyltranspeptidase
MGRSISMRARTPPQLVKPVNAKGGKLTLSDLSSYRPVWVEP